MASAAAAISLSTGRRAEPPRHAGRVLALVCAAQFALQLDFSIVNVAIPSVQRELHFAASELQWVVTGYTLTFGSLLLVGGRAADIVGRRRLLAAGLALFGLASLGAGLAGSPVMLIAMRIAQGAAGAMISPAAFSTLTTTYAQGEARNRALTIWQAATATGATTGIVAGGILDTAFGWRAIFLVNPPLIAVMVALVPRWLPAGTRDPSQRMDIPGAALATCSLAALILGVSHVERDGLGSAATLVPIAASVALGVLFAVVERHVRQPMLPLSIFANATRRAACVTMLLMGAITAGYVYFVSLYLQKVEGFSPILTGVALVPATVTVVLTSTLLTRRLLRRFSVKRILLAGLASVAAGQLWLAQISAGASYASAVLPELILMAFGIALIFPTVSVAVTSGVAPEQQGVAGALITTSQQAGAAVGLAVLAMAAATRTAATAHHSLTDGYRFSFLLGTGIALFASVIVSAVISSGACQEELGRKRRLIGGARRLVSEAEIRLRGI
jgi:EmrB/QacA subfamily drug resistance transporter